MWNPVEGWASGGPPETKVVMSSGLSELLNCIAFTAGTLSRSGDMRRHGINTKATSRWLKEGKLGANIEALIVVAHDGVTRTRAYEVMNKCSHKLN